MSIARQLFLFATKLPSSLVKEAAFLQLYAEQEDPALKNVGTPRVEVDPALGSEVEKAVSRIKKTMDPNFFTDVSKIELLSGGPFGQVSSEEPSVVKVNLSKIKSEVKRQLDEAFKKRDVKFNSSDPEHQKIFDKVLSQGIIEVVSHETGHVEDFKPQYDSETGEPIGGTFPGGEGVAENKAKQVEQRTNND